MSDQELLLANNLIHRHMHRHGDLVHQHLHSHDMEHHHEHDEH